MPTCQGRYAPPEAVALLLPLARTILKYALFYHGTGHLQKILNIAKTFNLPLLLSIIHRIHKERFDAIYFESLHTWNLPNTM